MKLRTAQDERGQAINLFVLVIMSALIITTGLVIDGGQKVTATSRAESAAAGAGRAAGNAAATQQLGDRDAASAAVLARRLTSPVSQASMARFRSLMGWLW